MRPQWVYTEPSPQAMLAKQGRIKVAIHIKQQFPTSEQRLRCTIQIPGYPAANDIQEYISSKGWVYRPERIFMIAFEPTRYERRGYPKGGWKLHVSAYPENCLKLALTLCPALCADGIWHKYVRSGEELSKMEKGQEGKFITIYTKSEEHLQHAVTLVTDALYMSGLAGPVVEGDIAVVSPTISKRFVNDFSCKDKL